ncbi:uncharacterized protein [Phaseolus vulgaris]|uniref:uncharacterized protein n=1 Tax=Phaseolus vulgaris TaxID=3885 RepID=UPI0035CAABFA
MCVDFTNLNKACPKDSYPLPSIDALVDSASGCRLLSFLDAFSGYNQIMMHPRDECKTAFMTELSCFCYKVMPFGLKNAGATYQRLMDRVLAPMLGWNVQAYVDGMVVTSQQKEQHLADLEELFTTIAKCRLKLNPEKGESREVRCYNSHEKPNIGERSAAVDRAHGRSVQICVGRRRQGTPLFPVPKEKQQVRLDQRVRRGVFEAKGVPGQSTSIVQAIARYPAPPLLRSYREGDQFCSATGARPGVEANLFRQQGVARARGEMPSLRKSNSGSSFLRAKNLPLLPELHRNSNDRPPNSQDGSSNQQGSGVGVILEGPDGLLIEQALWFAFKDSKNQAKYEALIVGMLLAKEMGANGLLAKSDSLLVTRQVTGEYQAKDPEMAAYLEYVQVLKESFEVLELVHIPREQNA